MIKFAALICAIFFYSQPTWANPEYRMILARPVGTGPDLIARHISRLVRQQSGITLVVNNVTGAGHFLAAQQFKQERLAVIFATTSMLIYGPLANTDELARSYGLQDFAIIADLGVVSSVVYTHPDSGIKTPQDLLRIMPTLKNPTVGVAAQNTAVEAAVLFGRTNVPIPTVSFKNDNEIVVQTAGKHITVGITPMNTDSVWALAKKGDLHIIGHTGPDAIHYKDFNVPSISRALNLPFFAAGVWVAITPGDSPEHRTLKTAILKAMQDPEVKRLINESYPLGSAVPFERVLKTAQDHQHLFRK